MKSARVPAERRGARRSTARAIRAELLQCSYESSQISLLEADQHQHVALALGQAGHRLAQNRTGGLLRIRSLHRMTWHVRGGEQIAGLDWMLRRIGQRIDSTGQRHILFPFQYAFL